MIAQQHISAGHTQMHGQFIGFTVVAAVTAAAAAFASATLSLPVWGMFIGWVAYYITGRPSARDGLANLTCLVLGSALGIGASLAIATLMPKFGVASVAIVVFVVATIVVSLRVVPIANNILSYFLGLIGYFASSHQEPALSIFGELGAAFALGSFAGWFANTIQSRLTRAA